MKPKLIGICATIAVFFSCNPLLAHHAFSVDYDSKRVLTVTGTIRSVQWANPHVMIELESAGTEGRGVRWVLEGGSPSTLTRAGVRRQDLAYGDVLSACGYGGKSARPDGVVAMAAEQIVIGGAQRFKISSYGIDTCLQGPTSVTPAPLVTADPGSSRDGSEFFDDTPAGRFENPPPVQPFGNPPVTAYYPALTRGGLPRSELRPPQPTSAFENSDLTQYDRSKSIHFTARVTAIDLAAAPNTYIFVTALGENWAIETSRIQLEQSSISPPIRVGDTIGVTGFFPEEFPSGPLPARFYPPAAPYLRTQHLIRAGEITLFSGQKIVVGLPPTREELERRRIVCAQVGC
jgi:hypothetical protein